MNRRLLVLAVMIAVPTASAVEEADAPAVWQEQLGTDWLVESGHTPERPEPGSQWEGHLSFSEGHNITEARYQICRVGEACFAAPTLAHQDGDTFHFDTAEYHDPVYDEPVHYEGGWRIGVQWVFTMEGTEEQILFPEGIPFDDPQCETDWLACSETHYLAFDMAEAQESEAIPGVGAALLVALVAASAYRRH